MATERVYNFEDAPNISLLDSRVVWWSESEICINSDRKRELCWLRDVINVWLEVVK